MPKSRGISGHEQQYEGKTNTWLTPRYVIDALGPFDLDPCAADPRPFDCATRNYTEAQNGTLQPWEGRVWLNPPYGPHVGIWLDLMARHGNGIALVFARTETRAMQRALRSCDAAYFPAKRISFTDEQGVPGKSTSGAPSMFLAFGADNIDALRGLEQGEGVLFLPDSAEE